MTARPEKLGLVTPTPAVLFAKTLDKKKDKEIWYNLLSKTILLDWKGIFHEGKSLGKYEPKLGANYMMLYKDFAKFVWESACEESLYHEEQEEEDEKNSPASSDTD